MAFLSCGNPSSSKEGITSITEKEYDDINNIKLKGAIPMPTHQPQLNDSTYYIPNSQRDYSSILKEWLDDNIPK